VTRDRFSGAIHDSHKPENPEAIAMIGAMKTSKSMNNRHGIASDHELDLKDGMVFPPTDPPCRATVIAELPGDVHLSNAVSALLTSMEARAKRR
jgi:hypothetical protein